MNAILKPKPARSKPPAKKVVLKTWEDAKKYFAEKLIPVAHGPKGQPIYSHLDIQNLNVELPEEIAILTKDSE